MMSKVMNLDEGVDTVLLIMYLVVVKLLQVVVEIPGKSILPPPMVTRMRCVSVLWGRILDMRHVYVTLHPAGILRRRTKKNCVGAGWHASVDSLI